MAICHIVIHGKNVTTDSMKDGRSFTPSVLPSLHHGRSVSAFGQGNPCNCFPANFGSVGKNTQHSFPTETAHLSHLLNQTSCGQIQVKKAAKPTVQLFPSIF